MYFVKFYSSPWLPNWLKWRQISQTRAIIPALLIESNHSKQIWLHQTFMKKSVNFWSRFITLLHKWGHAIMGAVVCYIALQEYTSDAQCFSLPVGGIKSTICSIVSKIDKVLICYWFNGWTIEIFLLMLFCMFCFQKCKDWILKKQTTFAYG